MTKTASHFASIAAAVLLTLVTFQHAIVVPASHSPLTPAALA